MCAGGPPKPMQPIRPHSRAISDRDTGLDCGAMDMELQLVQVPVSDVDRAKAFYKDKAGFNADHDHKVSDDIRFVQLTPPGSACSIAFGTGMTDMAPGSVQGLQLVVQDVHAVRAELAGRGVEVERGPGLPVGLLRLLQRP